MLIEFDREGGTITLTKDSGETVTFPSTSPEADEAATNAFFGIDPVADAKVARRREVDERLAQAFLGGFTVPSGPLAGFVLQVRNNEDRTNWLTSQASYSAMVAMGQGAVEGAKFRDRSDITHVITYAEGLTVLLQMAAWGAGLMGNSWALKDQIEAATTLAGVAAVDIEAGW